LTTTPTMRLTNIRIDMQHTIG